MASKPTGLYRTMLRMARALPKERRTVAIQQIKNSWNEHKAETDPKRYGKYARHSLRASSPQPMCMVVCWDADSINELVAEANKRLRMLQMMTPKSKTANEQSGVISYVVRDGKVVSGEAVQQEKAKWVMPSTTA